MAVDPSREKGFLGVCLVEGDDAQEARSRRIKRRPFRLGGPATSGVACAGGVSALQQNGKYCRARRAGSGRSVLAGSASLAARACPAKAAPLGCLSILRSTVHCLYDRDSRSAPARRSCRRGWSRHSGNRKRTLDSRFAAIASGKSPATAGASEPNPADSRWQR